VCKFHISGQYIRVSLCSHLFLRQVSGLAAYTASKWAATSFADCLRQELYIAESPIGLSIIRPWIVAVSREKSSFKCLSS
jgi:NADP-dependent 3-hydroxy acid dehydrogenase YdfG